jgi:hypothetical protein
LYSNPGRGAVAGRSGLAAAAWPQEAVAVIRFTTARQGGPVPVDEVTAFASDEPKVVAWGRIAAGTASHTVAFRWLDTQQRIYRVSPTRIVTAGEEFLSDELPLRDTPAAALTGVWTVELVVDNRVVATLRFSVVPPSAPPHVDTIRHQTTLSTRGQQTQAGGTYTATVVNSLEMATDAVAVRTSPELPRSVAVFMSVN